MQGSLPRALYDAAEATSSRHLLLSRSRVAKVKRPLSGRGVVRDEVCPTQSYAPKLHDQYRHLIYGIEFKHAATLGILLHVPINMLL